MIPYSFRIRRGRRFIESHLAAGFEHERYPGGLLFIRGAEMRVVTQDGRTGYVVFDSGLKKPKQSARMADDDGPDEPRYIVGADGKYEEAPATHTDQALPLGGAEGTSNESQT